MKFRTIIIIMIVIVEILFNTICNLLLLLFNFYLAQFCHILWTEKGIIRIPNQIKEVVNNMLSALIGVMNSWWNMVG
jgi:hypothetical protein